MHIDDVSCQEKDGYMVRSMRMISTNEVLTGITQVNKVSRIVSCHHVLKRYAARFIVLCAGLESAGFFGVFLCGRALRGASVTRDAVTQTFNCIGKHEWLRCLFFLF